MNLKYKVIYLFIYASHIIAQNDARKLLLHVAIHACKKIYFDLNI